MNLDELRIRLENIVDPTINQSIKQTNAIKHLAYDDEKDVVTLIVSIGQLGTPDEIKFRREIAKVVKIDCGYSGIKLELEESKISGSITTKQVKFIGIISGKGGVGKSSIAANIAVHLKDKGFKVGLIDADIYGSSIPTILNIPHEKPVYNDDKKIIPIFKDGLEVISTEFFTEPSQPVIWRGNLLNSMLNHFFYDMAWSPDLDYCIVDYPPGTGDITLDLKNIAPQMEMLLVTTPHPSAAHVAVKAGHAVETLGHNVIGVIENMSYYTNPVNNEREYIFGFGGGQKVAEDLDAELIAKLEIAQPKNGTDIFDSTEKNGRIYDEICDFLTNR